MPSTHPIRIDASFTFKDTGELQQFLDKKHFGEPIPDPDYGEIKKFLPNKNSAIQGFSPEYWTIGSSAYIFQDKVPRVNGTIVNNRIELTLHTDKSHLENTLDRLALSLKCIARASFAGFEKNYRLQLPPPTGSRNTRLNRNLRSERQFWETF
ncbi:MAG: hypothetical protein AAF998_02720 [Bacteroidota bacterium]